MVILGAVSVFWSVSPEDTVALLPGFSSTLLGGLLLVTFWSRSEPFEKDVIVKFLLVGYFVGLLFTAYEYFSEIQIIRFLRLMLLDQEVELHQ